MLRCIVCHNEEPVKTYEIDEPLVTIGRLPENTISIANMGISRRHVRIDRDVNRNYILSDLGSLNGTFVNNKKVKKVALQSGDRITIGKYTIILEQVTIDDPPRQPAAMPQMPPAAYSAEAQEPAYSQDAEHSVATPARTAQPVLIDTSKHTVYPLDKRILSLGASENDDIFIAGSNIGDAHLIIEKRDDSLWISSGKKGGKFKINGKKTTGQRLKHKDRLEIGGSIFAYMENG